MSRYRTLLLFRRAGRQGLERGAFEEGDFDVSGEAVEAEEPGLRVASRTIEGRVPSDGLAEIGNRGGDQHIEAAAHSAFPAGHGVDIGLHRRIAIRLADLRVAAGEKLWNCGGGCFGHGTCLLIEAPPKLAAGPRGQASPKQFRGLPWKEDPGSALPGTPGRAMFAAAAAKSGPLD